MQTKTRHIPLGRIFLLTPLCGELYSVDHLVNKRLVLVYRVGGLQGRNQASFDGLFDMSLQLFFDEYQ